MAMSDYKFGELLEMIESLKEIEFNQTTTYIVMESIRSSLFKYYGHHRWISSLVARMKIEFEDQSLTREQAERVGVEYSDVVIRFINAMLDAQYSTDDVVAMAQYLFLRYCE